jgi:hypothetical protein
MLLLSIILYFLDSVKQKFTTAYSIIAAILNHRIVEMNSSSQTGSFILGKRSATLPLKLTDIRIAEMQRETLAIGDSLLTQKLVYDRITKIMHGIR